ncbi:MAG: TolC family protein [Verrucomicrobia bacterium]|nr:TolC family protein [Verrucomicrobiota bacterium]
MTRRAIHSWLGCLAVAGLLSLHAGCSAARYRQSADREAYRLISEKSRKVDNMERKFTIEQTNRWEIDALPARPGAVDFLGDFGSAEDGAHVVSLKDALALATIKSRVYQSRREQLYLSSLSLSLARHQWTPLFSAGASARYDVNTETALLLIPDPNNPNQPKAVLSDSLVAQHKFNESSRINAGWLIRDIGRVSTAFTTDFLRFLTGDPRSLSRSQLSATFARPLLRNASYKQQMENLTQAERDLLYDIRDFTRFRKEFSVQVASAFYSVLGNRDTARNSFQNLKSSEKNAELTRALAAEGRIAQAELGRLEQQQLSVESAWINSVRAYRQALDDFKILLGVSVDARIALDDAELEALKIQRPRIDLNDAVAVALTARLDFQNTRDQYADSARKVGVAKNALNAQLDLIANASLNSGPDSPKGLPLPSPSRYSWNAGLDVDLPLDRKLERNNYRASLIAVDRASRDLSLKQDQIKQQIRDSHRALEQAERNFEIAEGAVKLAQRRVEEQNLLAEVGRAKAQDQVDAQNALNDAKNQRTQALVGHTVSRLQFWSNMGILFIKEQGEWEERDPAKALKNAEERTPNEKN